MLLQKNQQERRKTARSISSRVIMAIDMTCCVDVCSMCCIIIYDSITSSLFCSFLFTLILFIACVYTLVYRTFDGNTQGIRPIGMDSNLYHADHGRNVLDISNHRFPTHLITTNFYRESMIMELRQKSVMKDCLRSVDGDLSLLIFDENPSLRIVDGYPSLKNLYGLHH